MERTDHTEETEHTGITAAPPPRPWWRRARWIVAALVVAAGAALVAFGWFGVHLLFLDDSVDEAAPVFSSSPGAPPAAGASEPAGDGTTTPARPPGPTFTGMFEGVDHGATGTVVVLEGDGRAVLRFEADFSTSNGPDLFVYLGAGSGDYRDPASYVELGRLKGNEGSQNYEIPGDVDLAAFRTVAVWCKRFDSTFAVASLAPA